MAISVKNLPTTSVFNAPNEGIPLVIGYQRLMLKTRMIGLPE